MIYGKKTRLRRIERDDLSTFVCWFGDPEIRDFISINSPISMAQEEHWFQQQLQKKNDELFAIESHDGSENNVLIGVIGLHNIDWVHRHTELGVIIGEREYLSKGYGSDAIDMVLGFAFHELNLHRVSLLVLEDNARGIRAYEKCGFQLEGRMREAFFRKGRYQDQLQMAILDCEFDAKSRKMIDARTVG